VCVKEIRLRAVHNGTYNCCHQHINASAEKKFHYLHHYHLQIPVCPCNMNVSMLHCKYSSLVFTGHQHDIAIQCAQYDTDIAILSIQLFSQYAVEINLTKLDSNFYMGFKSSFTCITIKKMHTSNRFYGNFSIFIVPAGNPRLSKRLVVSHGRQKTHLEGVS